MDSGRKGTMEFLNYCAVCKLSDADLRKGIKSMAAKLFDAAPKCDQAYGPCDNSMVYASRAALSGKWQMVACFERLQRSIDDLEEMLTHGEDFPHTCHECEAADNASENASLWSAESGAGHEALLDDAYHRNNPNE